MLDLKIYKNTGEDPYCGNDNVCREGAEQICSLFLWVLVLVAAFSIGAMYESLNASRQKSKSTGKQRRKRN